MSTTADVASDLATAIEALDGSPTRMVSDSRTDLEAISSGATKYQLDVTPVGRTTDDANTARVRAKANIRLFHMLADSTDERTYTEGNLQTNITAITVGSWWRDLAAVEDIPEEVNFEYDPVSRIGNVCVLELGIELIVQS